MKREDIELYRDPDGDDKSDDSHAFKDAMVSFCGNGEEANLIVRALKTYGSTVLSLTENKDYKEAALKEHGQIEKLLKEIGKPVVTNTIDLRFNALVAKAQARQQEQADKD